MAKYVVTVNGQDYEVDGVNSPEEAYAAIGGQASQGPLEHDFSAVETAKNIPGSALQYGKDIVSPILSPIDTAKSLYGLGGSVLSKGQRKVQELAAGVDIPEGEDEASANAMGDYIKERYGGIEELQRTLQEDPVGLAADLSGAGMLSKINKVQQVGRMTEPVNLLKNTATAARDSIAKRFPDKPVEDYLSTVKFSTVKDAQARRAMVQTALDEGVMPTRSGVAQVRDRIDILNNQLDELIMDAVDRGIEVPVQAVAQHLQDLRATKGRVRLGASKDVAKINKIAKDFFEDMKEMGKDTITPEDLQFFKTEAYKDINWNPGKRKPRAAEEAYKAMARGAKDAIAREIPEATGINRKLGELYELEPNLEKAANRIENLNKGGLTMPLNISAGGIVDQILGTSGVGAGIGALKAVRDNPKIKARLALALDKVQKNDVKWLKENAGTPELRIIMMMAGRTEEELSGQQATQ